jgi:GntR family transcriptional regulator
MRVEKINICLDNFTNILHAPIHNISFKSCVKTGLNECHRKETESTVLNPDAPIPLYRQLADLISEKIRKGQYLSGGRIPSEPKLAATYGLGRPTVRQAIELMVRRGLLRRRRGSGTYVCDLKKEVDLFSLDGTGASFAKTGEPVETKILTPITLSKVNDHKDNPFNGQTAYTLLRLTRVSGVSVLLENLFLHAGLFNGIDRMEITGRSLSTIADEKYYLRPNGGKQSFYIDYLNGIKADHLQVTSKTPVLSVHRWLNFPQTKNGVYAQLWCRTDRFVFSQTIGGTGYA